MSSANTRSGEKITHMVDTYIPTPDANGSCEPHIEHAAEEWFWVVCEDCSTELVEGRENALAQLDDCGGASTS
jgi:hypothetical protein